MANAPHVPESEEDAARSMQLLQLRFRHLDSLETAIEALEIAEGSPLDGDRKAAPYNPGPDQVIGCLSVATDHLRGVQVAVEDSGGKILALALYTLIRSAYEAVGSGLWLLAPASRDERTWRSMQLVWEGRRLVREVRVALGEKREDDIGFTRMDNRLRELRDARPGLAGRPLKRSDITSVTERLKSISPLVPDLIIPPLALWQMSSGIAHGNTSMIRQVMDREQVSPYENGSATFRVTTSVGSLAMFYDTALILTERLITLYQERNCTPGAEPSDGPKRTSAFGAV